MAGMIDATTRDRWKKIRDEAVQGGLLKAASQNINGAKRYLAKQQEKFSGAPKTSTFGDSESPLVSTPAPAKTIADDLKQVEVTKKPSLLSRVGTRLKEAGAAGSEAVRVEMNPDKEGITKLTTSFPEYADLINPGESLAKNMKRIADKEKEKKSDEQMRTAEKEKAQKTQILKGYGIIYDEALHGELTSAQVKDLAEEQVKGDKGAPTEADKKISRYFRDNIPGMEGITDKQIEELKPAALLKPSEVKMTMTKEERLKSQAEQSATRFADRQIEEQKKTVATREKENREIIRESNITDKLAGDAEVSTFNNLAIKEGKPYLATIDGEKEVTIWENGKKKKQMAPNIIITDVNTNESWKPSVFSAELNKILSKQTEAPAQKQGEPNEENLPVVKTEADYAKIKKGQKYKDDKGNIKVRQN